MTPKEKAEDLLSIFAKIIPASSYEAYEGGVKINFDLENAKQCALIAVEEILDSHYKLLSGVNTSIYKYWQEVKQEINLL
jgi:hypothetical protein